MEKQIAILTPTYNRAELLERLYQCLCRQTSTDFKWYIVDDGSSDHTKSVVSDFQATNFEIEYIYKENGGKHTACNVGFERIRETLTFIVDSDDYLTDDAVETIVADWEKYGHGDHIGGLSYHRMNRDGIMIGDPYVGGDVVVSSYVDMRINKKVSGDSAEIYRTDILKQMCFPEIKGETFMSEAVLWHRISEAGYQLVYISKAIYYCEYLTGGLTSQARKKQLSNPKGTMLHAEAHLAKDIRLPVRVKYMLMYIAIAKMAGVSYHEAFVGTRSKGLFVVEFLPAMLLKHTWELAMHKKTFTSISQRLQIKT